MKLETDQNEYVVILDIDGFQFKNISLTKYLALSEEERQTKTEALLRYFESIPSISMDEFKNPDGSYVKYVTRAKIEKVILDIYAQFAPAVRPKWVPRMPSDVLIDWISTLEHAKNEILTTPAALDVRDRRISLIERLLEDRKLQWLKHHLTTHAIRSALLHDSNELRSVGLDDLADFAYKPRSKNTLSSQLARSNTISRIDKRINENKYSAAFESLLIGNLLTNPPQNLLDSMGEIGKGLNQLLDDITNKKHLEESFIPELKAAIKADQTHWYKGVPEVQAFIDASNASDALSILRTILTIKPTNGIQLVLIPYLVQKFYKPYSVAYNLGHQTPLTWVGVTQRNYDRLILIRNKNHRPATTVFNELRVSKLKGLFRWDSSQSISSNSSSDSNQQSVQFIKKEDMIEPQMGSFIRRTLQHGIPVGKGVSGTTNLFLGTIAHLIKDKNLNIDANEALLGLVSFLIYDGGHSLHEALWTVYQRESLHSVDSDQKKYLQLGLNVKSASGTPQKSSDFISDYDHFIKLFETSQSIKSTLNNALNLSWNQTIAFFDEKDYFSGRFLLEKMLEEMMVDLEKKPELNIEERLKLILETGEKALHAKSQLVIAAQLENMINNISPIFFSLKNAVLTKLNKIVHYERVQHKLLNTIKKHSEFSSFNKENIRNLMPHGYPSNEGIDSTALLSAFNYMLTNRNEELTIDSLIRLLLSYDLALGGTKVPNVSLLKNRFKCDPVAYAYVSGFPSYSKNAELETVLGYFITKYYSRLTKAVSEVEKLAVIAKFIQDLAFSFTDDVSKQVIKVIVTNKLLLQNKLSPTIFNNPEKLNEFPISQIIEEIRTGQQSFKDYTIPQSTIASEQTDLKLANALEPFNEVFDHDFIIDYKDEYISLKNKLQNERAPSFLLGNSDSLYKDMTIRGYHPDMSLQEMYMLAVTGELNLKELGALTRHIDAATEQVEKIAYIQQHFKEEQTTASSQLFDIDSDLDLSSASLKQTQLIENFLNASQKLYQENQLSHDWVPVLESVKAVPEKGAYRISFFNPQDTEGKQIATIETTDEIFIKVKKELNNSTTSNSKSKKTGNRLLKAKPTLGRPFSGTGLSFLFAANAYFSPSNGFQGSPISENLAKALQLHYYVNMTNLGIGVTQDIIALGAFGLKETANPLASLVIQNHVKGYVNAAKSIGLTTEPFEKVLPRVISGLNTASKAVLPAAKPILLFASKGVPIVGTVLNAVSVGFDIYELSQAETDQQKKIFGTKLAFGSASLGLTVGGTVAPFVGASSIAGPLFIVAIPVAVTGGGIVQAMQFYDNVEQLIEHQVVNYFDQVATAYQKGYIYNKNTNTLTISSGAVIKKIDFESGNIIFGSQYVCLRDQTDKRRVSGDITTAVNLRAAIGSNDRIHMGAADKDASVIFLPDTPISYISYNTANIQALSEYKGPKYDLIRRIESSSQGKFDLEHFSFFIHDNIVQKLFHQYKPTDVDILLDGLSRTLIVPELPKQTAKVLNKESTIRFSNSINDFNDERNNNHQQETLPNAIHYNIVGKGGQYTIGLNEGATIHISTTGTKSSKWILNTSTLDKDDVEIDSDKLTIGGVAVHVGPVKNSGSELIIVKQDGNVCAIDIKSKSSKIIQLDAEKWVKKHPKTESFDVYIKRLSQENQLSGKYIPVDNYVFHSKKASSEGIQNDLKTILAEVKRAYYDVDNDRMLFSINAPIDGTPGTILGDNVYFYNKEHNTIWQTDTNTGKVKVQYFMDPFRGLVKDGVRVRQEDNQVYAAFDYTYNEGNAGELIFHLKEDLIELVSLRVNIKRVNLFKNGSPLTSYLGAKFDDPTDSQFQFPNAKIINTTQVAPVVIIYDRDDASSSNYRYWLRTLDKVLIKPDLPNPSADKLFRLKFIGSIKQSEGLELFYFLDPTENALYFQKGAERQTEDSAKPIAFHINGNFVNAEIIESKLFATTKEGLVNQVDANGDLALACVNEQWTVQQGKDWLNNLHKLKSQSFMVQGLKYIDEHTALPAWYYDGQLVVAPNLKNHDKIELLGVYDGYARFFDITRMKVYEQEVATEDELSAAFGDDHILDYPEFIGDATDLFPTGKLKSISSETDTLRLVTKEGVILRLETSGDINLVGVDAGWQLQNPNLNTSMDSLAKKWAHHGAVLLEGDTGSAPSWYVFGVGKVVPPSSIANNQFQFIGKTISDALHGTTVYFSDLARGMLYCYQYGLDGSFINQSTRNIHVQRFGSSLLIQGTNGEDSLIPLIIEGITSVTMSGKTKSDTYVLNKQAWSSFKNIVIDNFSTDSIDDTLELIVGSHNELYFFQKEDDLVIANAVNNSSIVTIRNIFGDEKSNYNHLKFITNDGQTAREKHITDLIANTIILSSTQPRLLITDPSILDYRDNSSSNEKTSITANLEARYVDKAIVSENNQKAYVRDTISDKIRGVFGTPNDDTLHGDDKGNSLNGMAGNDFINGKRGNDLLVGGTGNDMYQFAANDGHDTIEDIGGDVDTVKFILGQMELNQILLQRDNNNLLMSYNNKQDSITISNHFLSENNRIEYIQFNNDRLYDVDGLTQTAFNLSTNKNQWSYGLSTLFETP